MEGVLILRSKRHSLGTNWRLYLVIKTAHVRCICAATCFRLLHGYICLAVSMISVTTINSLFKSIWYQLVPSCTEENIVRLIVSLEKESVRQHGIDTTNSIITRIWLVVLLHLDEVSMRLWTLFHLCSFICLP
jgi:hypothetical protein